MHIVNLKLCLGRRGSWFHLGWTKHLNNVNDAKLAERGIYIKWNQLNWGVFCTSESYFHTECYNLHIDECQRYNISDSQVDEKIVDRCLHSPVRLSLHPSVFIRIDQEDWSFSIVTYVIGVKTLRMRLTNLI